MASPAKILVVDDELALRLTLTEILERDGHRVITATGGRAALELIKNQTFDLALIDLKLGDMPGVDVLAALKQESPETVAIMLTAHASLETAVEALRRGAYDYLFKPCSPADLRESVRQGLLKRRQNMQQNRLLHQLEQNLTNTLADIRSAAGSSRLPGPEQFLEPPVVAGRQPSEEGRFLQYGGLIVDLLGHIITLDGCRLELSPAEFDLLAYLAGQAPRVVSTQELAREVQGYQSEAWAAGESMRAHIYNIRQKIKKATRRTDVIRTARGVGYAVNRV